MISSNKSQRMTKEEVKSHSLDSGFHSGINTSCSSTTAITKVVTENKRAVIEIDSGLGIDSPSCSTFSNLSLKDEDDKTSDKQVGDSGFDISFNSEKERQHENGASSHKVQLVLKNAETVSKEYSRLLTPELRITLINEAFQQDKDGDTRLHLSVIEGRLDLVFSLIFLTSQPEYLDIQNNQLQTAIHLAVITGRPNIVRPLVLAGASLMLRDRNGNTALHLACQLGYLECVKQLTSEITSLEQQYLAVTSPFGFPPLNPPKLPSPQVIMDTRNYQGRSCVHLAALNQHTNVLLWLKKCGADIDAKEGCSGRTSITFAVESRDMSMVDFLVKECSANINSENYAGQTAYQIAYKNDRKIADHLTSLGAHTFYDDYDDQETDSDDETMDICSPPVSIQTPPPSALNAQDEEEEKRNFYDLKINGEPLW